MTNPPGFAAPRQRLRFARPHGLRADVNAKLQCAATNGEIVVSRSVFAAIAFLNHRHDHGVVRLKLNVNGPATCFQTNHDQHHWNHLSGRNENANPRRGPCHAAEPMTCPALPSGPTSGKHSTALPLREEGGRPTPVWSSDRGPHANTPQPLAANSAANATSYHHGPLFVYSPVCDFEPCFSSFT